MIPVLADPAAFDTSSWNRYFVPLSAAVKVTEADLEDPEYVPYKLESPRLLDSEAKPL